MLIQGVYLVFCIYCFVVQLCYTVSITYILRYWIPKCFSRNRTNFIF